MAIVSPRDLMAEEKPDVEEFRKCPFCKNGIGKSDGTVTTNRIKRIRERGYKCQNTACRRRWFVRIQEIILDMRYKRVDDSDSCESENGG